MKIRVKVKPGTTVEKVALLNQAELGLASTQPTYPTYEVSVKALPIEGKATKAVVHALADYFKVAPSHVRLISGPKSRWKLFEIDTPE